MVSRGIHPISTERFRIVPGIWRRQGPPGGLSLNTSIKDFIIFIHNTCPPIGQQGTVGPSSTARSTCAARSSVPPGPPAEIGRSQGSTVRCRSSESSCAAWWRSPGEAGGSEPAGDGGGGSNGWGEELERRRRSLNCLYVFCWGGASGCA